MAAIGALNVPTVRRFITARKDLTVDKPTSAPSSAAARYKREYAARIHRAQDYIEQNIGADLRLEDVARAANFSAFHFHRLYTAMTGETLFQFIQRIRLERAASRLCQKPSEPVTAIAFDLGFSSPATFARAFRASFGVCASVFRSRQLSKQGKVVGNEGKEPADERDYSVRVNFDTTYRRKAMSNVEARSIEVRDLPAKHLAYIRHVGPYAGDSALFERLFAKVFAWAGARELMVPGQSEVITIYHDDPAITAQDKLRVSAGITVPAATPVGGEIGLLEIPAGKYVCARFEIAVDEFGAAWDALCSGWLPGSGWQPGDGPCYECSLNDHRQHPEGKFIVDIRMSVKPL